MTDQNKCMPCRQGARDEIKQKIKFKRQEADDLEKLLELLPEDMPEDADYALWRLLTNSFRR